MRRIVMAIVFLGVAAAVVHATSPCTTVVQSPAYVAPVYATPILPAVFVPAPSYTVGLSHQVDTDAKLDEILRRLDAIEAARSPAAIVGLDAAAVLASECMRCHAVGTPASRSGGYTFDPKRLTARDRARIVEQVESGAMPPSGSLTHEQRGALLGLAQ